MELRLIPATTFEMGSLDGADDERPLHRVALSAFEIGVYQVTNEEWSRFRTHDFDDARKPVTSVSWFDAVDFCEWLRETTSRPFRLPTEAEWEWAARGGVEGARYPWGDEPLSQEGRWVGGPERAGSDQPNGFGLYDFCTNVHEWCSDWYGPYPTPPATGTRGASRGGAWRHRVKVTRCAARSSLPPSFRYADYGFRVACNA